MSAGDGAFAAPRSHVGARSRRVGVALALASLSLLAAACGGGSDPTQQANALLAKGIAAVRSGNCHAAVADFNQIIQKSSNNKSDSQYAYYNRGYCEELASQATKAIKDYRSALAIDPNYPPALYNLAIMLTPSSPMQAENLYLQVIAVQPTNASAHLNLGFVYLALDQHDAAIQQFALAVQEDPACASRIPKSLQSEVDEAVAALPASTSGASGTTGAVGGSASGPS